MARGIPVALIASVARNGSIGNGGDLVWHEPADKRWFRQQTMGCPVVMGRKTWDSLPERFRPLPGRANVVVSRQPGYEATGAQVAPDLAAALALARHSAAQTGAVRICVIGGGQLYADALPLADELVLTEIDADLPGDTRFPTWNRADFTECARQAHRSEGPEGHPFAFVTYQRKR
jgi:dihydrofolate reductase